MSTIMEDDVLSITIYVPMRITWLGKSPSQTLWLENKTDQNNWLQIEGEETYV